MSAEQKILAYVTLVITLIGFFVKTGAPAETVLANPHQTNPVVRKSKQAIREEAQANYELKKLEEISREKRESEKRAYAEYKKYLDRGERILEKCSKGLFGGKWRKRKVQKGFGDIATAHRIYPKGVAKERYDHYLNIFPFMRKGKNQRKHPIAEI